MARVWETELSQGLINGSASVNEFYLMLTYYYYFCIDLSADLVLYSSAV